MCSTVPKSQKSGSVFFAGWPRSSMLPESKCCYYVQKVSSSRVPTAQARQLWQQADLCPALLPLCHLEASCIKWQRSGVSAFPQWVTEIRCQTLSCQCPLYSAECRGNMFCLHLRMFSLLKRAGQIKIPAGKIVSLAVLAQRWNSSGCVSLIGSNVCWERLRTFFTLSRNNWLKHE